MITGGCLCGKVRYRYSGEISEIAYCHCSQCRKAQGVPFATNSPINDAELTIEGEEHLKLYQSSSNKVRAFCQECGSPLYSAKHSLPGIKRLRLGTVDGEITCDNRYHIHADSSVNWQPITDSHKRYDAAKQ